MHILFALLLPLAAIHASTITATAGSGYSPGSISISQPGSIAFALGGGNATSTVAFGFASVYANSNCGGVDDCSAYGDASFSDTITILDAAGSLYATPNLEAIRANDEGSASSDFAFGSNAGLMMGRYYSGTDCLSGMAVCTFLETFTPGMAIHISGSAHAGASDRRPRDPDDGSQTDWASVRFEFAVLDSNGSPLSGFRYTSESGHDYALRGGTFVPVPEPWSPGLVMAGVVVVAHAGKRRKSYC